MSSFAEENFKHEEDLDSIPWYRISLIGSDSRVHLCIEGRYVTIFKRRGSLHCMDAICHHAGGPLTDGPLIDIEELHTTVVSCPWHRYKISLDGYKIFQGVEFDLHGKPGVAIWKKGKKVQRAHEVFEDDLYTYIKLNKPISESETTATDICASDEISKSELCGGLFLLHNETPEKVK
jgi:nitrite reductase/ring-hydroxylating ferredoxin subunit